MKFNKLLFLVISMLGLAGCVIQSKEAPISSIELSDKEIDTIVRHSYQYIAMYNTLSNFAMQKTNPFSTKGWNKMYIPEGLTDHNMTAIPRPNNDSLYLIAMLDMRDDAVVIQFPAYDSKYVSLETSAYDHYVNIPLTTMRGDFAKPTTMLFYTEHTKGYNGEPIKGVDKTLKMTGDFAVAFSRITPQASEPERMQRNIAAMKTQKLMTLAQFQGKEKKPVSSVNFPAFSDDQAVFKNNFLEVMQFTFNHTLFNPKDKMDQQVLALLKPLGVEPGKNFVPQQVTQIDGDKFSQIAAKIQAESLAIWNAPTGNPYLTQVFLPKGEMTLKPMVVQSAVGPIGLPFHQAQYPGVGTANGQPMNAKNHYVIRMTKEQLPPAQAFWSATLYDAKKGLFIPNDNYKYSVGENGGMKLNEQGGIEIHISPKQPAGVPKENWLPSGGKDEQLDILMRIYAPVLEAMKTWKVPKAEKL